MGRIRKELHERFMNKIVINELSGCWEWQAAKNNIGYAFIRDGNKMRTAHRVSYELHKGDIPRGLCVCHSCDNPMCVNPDHLWLGTHKDNLTDMKLKGRAAYGSNFRGVTQRKETCPYCGKVAGTNMITRWHKERCKHKDKV